jgi:leucine dehydrogenase
VERVIEIDDRATGLRAVIAIHSTALGPAAGGVRTRAYPTFADAVADAGALARAMTAKCALAGLDAGGGKAVVWDHGEWDRAAGFERLGEAIEALGGAFRTAGDLGTTAADLSAMARRCRFVHTDEVELAASVARGLAGCGDACLVRRGARWEGIRVALRGAGAIGSACARALTARGAQLVIADLDPARAASLAAELGGTVVSPDDVLAAEVDLVVPCAAGGTLTAAAVAALRAWAVVPAANNAVADAAAARLLVARRILHVPDLVASAGAVIEGIGRTVMHLMPSARGQLIDALGHIAKDVLDRSAATATPADEVAESLANARIRAKNV